MNKGFSLAELLLYVGILAITSGLLFGILLTTTRVQLSETASNEVNSQLNFTLQTIQRLVRSSSNIEVIGADNPETTLTTELAYMKLRMKDASKDPTCVSQVGNAIRVIEGPQSTYPNDRKCKETNPADNITTDKVIAPSAPLGLQLSKYSNQPGHDSVQIDITLSYSTTNPQSALTRTLQTAIGRASAATFDSDLLPATAGLRNIGQPATQWLNGYFAGDLVVENNLTVGEPGGNNGYFRFTRSGAGDPPPGECGANDTGRLYLRTNSPIQLFICNGSTGWESVNLDD